MHETPLFDFQINGFGGIDFQKDNLTPAELRHAVAVLRRHGTGAIFLTLTTVEVDRLYRRLEGVERACAADPELARMIVGYHLEGPYLSPKPGFCGAHPPGPMHAPSAREFARMQEAAGGRVKLVTLAPEWPGSPEFIAGLRGQGVQVALGHTDASETDIDAAIAAGARFVTHLGNGAPLTMHRHDNVIQRLLARDELTACLIPDGIHLPPFVLRNFFRAKPKGKVLFTTDAMSAAGAPPGTYAIGDLTVAVGADGIVRQPGGGGFAGSALAPDEGVRRTAAFLGLDLAAARRFWCEDAFAAFGLSLPK